MRISKSLLFSPLAFALAFVLSFSTNSVAKNANPGSCVELFDSGVRRGQDIAALRGKPLPERSATTMALANFAAKHDLPARWLELGPPERRVQRLFVAVDQRNKVVFQDYLETFNLNQPISPTVPGTLVLEFAKESKARPEREYITGALRTSAKVEDQIYRWGRKDLTYTEWSKDWLNGPNYKSPETVETGLVGFAHLIELNKQEHDNVSFYLQHSNTQRPSKIVGPCKSNNCVAWTSNIELGTTKEGATAEERRHLLPELGVSRAMAHFEIARRLIHAANDRHTAVVALVNGQLGLKSFSESLEQYLVPEPKIPYANIIRGLKFKSPANAAVAVIEDGAKVFLPIAAGASPEAVNALVERAAILQKGLDVHVLVNGVSANAFRDGVETTDGKFRVHALFLGGNLRELYQEGKVNVIPGNLSDFTRIMRDPNQTDFHYDAIVVRVSPPRNGRYSLGPNNDMIQTIIRNRPGIKIIAEVNPNVPFTHGENFLTEAQITSKFESTSELAGPAVVPPSAVDSAIGDNIGRLVDTGANLQIGIGNIFSAVPEGLRKHGKSNLSIFTEMFGDAMMEMIDQGTAIKADTGFAYGSKSLYTWLHDNQKVTFRETEYVNSIARVSEMPKFHAVNTALQVNLFGEVNATMGPNGRISSPGGQVEFMTGGARSAGGKAVIAIRSTAKNETISSIVLDLYRGPITTPHESVTHVVTEYGIAELSGKSEPDRAAALISVAHPKFRAQLIADALQRKMIDKKRADALTEKIN